ncbi:MAG: hypothetical protein RLY16_2542 [Bacteroidota bacterium]
MNIHETSHWLQIKTIVKHYYLFPFSIIIVLFSSSCRKDTTSIVPPNDTVTAEIPAKYNLDQTLSSGAQKNTIAFDALGFMVGNLGAQTFLPPGKVADYSGFQYLRDNDPTEMGHNTDFVTIIAKNVLGILNDQQIQKWVAAANSQVALINEYAYKRYPLCKAFRRLLDNDLPAGTTTLNEDAVKQYSGELYQIDGQISYNRAQLFGETISSLSTDQANQLKALKLLNGIGHWSTSVADKLGALHLSHDVNVAVMTYASEMYAWYAGSTTADVYFCPERQGTYFGSFYLKDWPAMGNPNYTINEQLTATAGEQFYGILDSTQYNLINGIVTTQNAALIGLVQQRSAISIELRKFLAGSTASASTVSSLSFNYGSYDGTIIYQYATKFAAVYHSLTAAQKLQIKQLGANLGYVDPPGGFLYSSPIGMPTIPNTDFMFR